MTTPLGTEPADTELEAPTSLDEALSGGLDGAETLAALEETAPLGDAMPPGVGDAMPPGVGAATDVHQVGLPDLAPGTTPSAVHADGRDLRLLADIELELTVELGRARIPLRELLSLTPGVVLELDRAAGEPVDVLVNGRVVARGEVVVVDGDFGVRVNEITDQA